MKKLIAMVVLALLVSARAGAAEFRAEIGGPNPSLSLRAYITPSSGVGAPGKMFVGVLIPSVGAFFLTQTGWQSWTGGDIPAYSSGTLASTSIQILSQMNVTPFAGTQVYVGYGASTADMLSAGTFALLHTVGEMFIPQGVRVSLSNQLPPGCVSSASQCWRDALADGTVRVLKTSIVSGVRPIVFVFFRGSAGLYNFLALFADNLFPSNIVGGRTTEFEWMEGAPAGVLYHVRGSAACGEFIFVPSPLRVTEQSAVCP